MVRIDLKELMSTKKKKKHSTSFLQTLGSSYAAAFHKDWPKRLVISGSLQKLILV
jgi:hypothetical protein